MFLNSVGERVEERRKDLRLTQQDLVDRIMELKPPFQWDRSIISKIERNNRWVRDYELPYLAVALGWDVNTLLNWPKLPYRT